MRLKFVLARLTRENDDKRETAMVDDGVFDGESDFALIGAQVDLAGERPEDRIAADGGAD